ncbi:hypothetical protein [Umezakia ovalisporum]|uniref:hypothetical protein n=1 Tax=Umezakia ovalisporum TaxID=75695 RepID=UPI0035B9EDE9
MKPVVFIHTSCHEILAAKVAAYSHMVFSQNTDKFDIKIIQIEDYPEFTKHHGQEIIRSGKEGQWYKDVPQSFLPLRFIVPQLMGFQGKAVLTDPDIFAVADIYELFQKDMQGKAILSRKIGTGIPGYNSSVMLFDCEKMSHWKWQEMIDGVFSKKIDLQDLITLRTEAVETIGKLEEEWNHYDTLNNQTKLLHNTRQITQPWKTGLPYREENLNNYNKSKNKVNYVKKIMRYRGKGKKAVLKAIINVFLYGEPALYLKHPDDRQEELFLAFLKEGLESGFIESQLIETEIKAGHIRTDMFKLLNCSFRKPSEIISEIKNTASGTTQSNILVN